MTTKPRVEWDEIEGGYSVIVNNTETDKAFINWYLSVKIDDKITEAKYFTVSTSFTDNKYTLTPERIIETLNPNTCLYVDIKTEGTISSITFENCLLKNNIVLEDDFTLMDSIKNLYGYFYKYDATLAKGFHANKPNPAVFDISERGLTIKSYEKPSYMEAFAVIHDGFKYYLDFTVTIHQLIKTDIFVLFSRWFNVKFTLHKDRYEFIVGNDKIIAKINPEDDIDVPVRWFMRFRITKEGYFHICREDICFNQTIKGEYNGEDRTKFQIGICNEVDETVMLTFKEINLTIED